MTAQSRNRTSPVDGLRIVVVNWRDPWHPEAGGAETYAWQVARGLRRRGADMTFLTARAAGQIADETRDGIRIVRVGKRFTVYPRVLGWILPRRRAFDAVIDCQNGIPFFTPWVLPRQVPVFCVMHHVHDAQFGAHFSPLVAAIGRVLEGPVARRAYRRQQCVAVSESTAAAMTSRLRWTGQVDIIPNGLIAPSDHVAAAVTGAGQAAGAGPASAGGPEEPAPSAITWVGRIVVHKRAELALDVAERVGEAGLTVDIIGRGPGSAALAAEVARRGLQRVVLLRGFLPEELKQSAVARSVLHLNTSLGEGWGLCVLEAAALGVPTVAFDVDGLRDAVRHGETGWLVRTGERIEDVTERALKELADPTRRAEVASACRAWAARFDWDRSAGQFAELIAAQLPVSRPAEPPRPA